MANTVQITATVGAYIAEPGSEYRGHHALVDAINDPEEHAAIVGSLLSYAAHDMSRFWQRVGEAQITVTLASLDDQVSAAITALKGRLDEERAKFMRKQAEIMEQISKLQSITYEPS